ncbi:MAG: hypothetical protein XXXJIFNMEKO3_03204 [Candidatus Erwinia impunctatus]
MNTASQLLPLSLVYKVLPAREDTIRSTLYQLMQNNRTRLMQLAGPQARFAWWGGSADSSALLTAYAYYADWHASQAMGLSLPASQWQRMLELYAEQAGDLPLLHRALILTFAQEMKLPVNSLIQGLDAALLDYTLEAHTAYSADNLTRNDSLILYAANSDLGIAAARTLTDVLLGRAQLTSTESTAVRERAKRKVTDSALPLARTIALLAVKGGEREAAAILRSLTSEQASIDRALAINWLAQRVNYSAPSPLPSPGEGWRKQSLIDGGHYWLWEGKGVPETISQP